MQAAWKQALYLIVSMDPELWNILSVTAKLSLSSSLIALAAGVPLGILLGAYRFPGRKLCIILTRTWMGIPPVVCGLFFYLLFSGVGPFRSMKLLFTTEIMILAQVFLITPLVIHSMENHVSTLAFPVRETAAGLGFGPVRTLLLLSNECVYQILAAYLLAFSRAIAEVGAVSMVGGGIAWKTNVMTTAIMQYTNRGDFSMGIALGLILMAASLMMNTAVSLLQRRVSGG